MTACPDSSLPPRLPRINNENRVFAAKTGRIAQRTTQHFSRLAYKIRYLADQWNFSPDQRIKAAVTTE
jgi:hypothetical protein